MAKRSEIVSLKALFIGNSFTARNNVPGLIEQLAAARGKQFEHRLIQAGGASLRMHWNRHGTRRADRSRRYGVATLPTETPTACLARQRPEPSYAGRLLSGRLCLLRSVVQRQTDWRAERLVASGCGVVAADRLGSGTAINHPSIFQTE
jgi:hypothetical protein